MFANERIAVCARVYILIVLYKITMTPLIKGKSYVVTAEVLHFLYNLHFPRIFLILSVRCIDHNSLRITNLFSGHTICFCALPIYFLRFFCSSSSFHKIRSHIGQLHWCNLLATTSALAHISTVEFQKKKRMTWKLNESVWINTQTETWKCTLNENRIQYLFGEKSMANPQ